MIFASIAPVNDGQMRGIKAVKPAPWTELLLRAKSTPCQIAVS